MNFKNKHGVLLLILFVVTLTTYGCAEAILFTPSPAISVATQTPSPKPIATRTSTPDEFATAHAVETASINDIVVTVQPMLLASYPSSDGKWRADIIRYDCMDYSYQDYVGSIAYEQLKIVNLSDGTEKIVEDQLQNCGGIGAAGLDGLYWSPSNRYFYYSDWREGTPDGGCGGYLALPIYRFDILTQEIITIGGSHISPDQTKLAFWQKNEIVIWDLDQGEVARVPSLAPDVLNGDIAWSPDGQSIIYLQTTFDCAPDYGTTYMTRLELAKLSQTLLLKSQPPGFGGVSWGVINTITLVDGGGKEWNYDLKTREINAVLAYTTPVPLGTFALKFYPPLILEYDTSEWKDESRYEDTAFMVNFLLAKPLSTCRIGVQGPTDFNGTPPVFVPVQLGNVSYSVIFWGESHHRDMSAWYIEDQSLTGYDYSPGLPILVVQADAFEWEECKALAEKVLATLRAP
jgi:hypothetical protein